MSIAPPSPRRGTEGSRRELGWTFAFAVTMGFFEAAVVVYLNRLQSLGELSVPPGFPTSVSPGSPTGLLILTEVLREAASLLMIASVACLTARGAVARLAQAAVIFGIWDICYYLFLRLLIQFPETLLSWDVLFLIPRPWVGPVLAPLLVSAALVAGGLHALSRERRGEGLRPAPWKWGVALLGGLLVILSFMLDTPAEFDGTNFPSRFRWPLFLAGLALGAAAYLSSLRRPPAPAPPAHLRTAASGDPE